MTSSTPLALAITAKLGSRERGAAYVRLPKFLSPAKFLRLPDMDSPPTDCEGLPMEMVYVIPNDTESSSGSAKMTDSAIKYVGVDGCKAGWIGVGLSDGDGCPKVEVCKEFADLVACFGDACVILVDIPIGLPEDTVTRACDIEARKTLEKRGGRAPFSQLRPGRSWIRWR